MCHFDEYEGDDAPQQIVKEWLSKCIRFNFDSNINVGIICATNLGVCASLTSFHGVEQVIFTDTIEVDSESLPEGQTTFKASCSDSKIGEIESCSSLFLRYYRGNIFTLEGCRCKHLCK